MEREPKLGFKKVGKSKMDILYGFGSVLVKGFWLLC